MSDTGTWQRINFPFLTAAISRDILQGAEVIAKWYPSRAVYNCVVFVGCGCRECVKICNISYTCLMGLNLVSMDQFSRPNVFRTTFVTNAHDGNLHYFVEINNNHRQKCYRHLNAKGACHYARFSSKKFHVKLFFQIRCLLICVIQLMIYFFNNV